MQMVNYANSMMTLFGIMSRRISCQDIKWALTRHEIYIDATATSLDLHWQLLAVLLLLGPRSLVNKSHVSLALIPLWGLQLHRFRGAGEVGHFSEVARLGPWLFFFFKERNPAYYRRAQSQEAALVWLMRLARGVCDTRSAINWIEDVVEDNDSLVALFFSARWTGQRRKKAIRDAKEEEKNPHTSKRSIPVGKCQKRSRIPRGKWEHTVTCA